MKIHEATKIIVVGLFTLLGLVHLLRLIFQWNLTLQNWPVPLWFSAMVALISVVVIVLTWVYD